MKYVLCLINSTYPFSLNGVTGALTKPLMLNVGRVCRPKTTLTDNSMTYTYNGPRQSGGKYDDVIKWNIFRVTGPLCGEFTGHRWIPLTQASDAELWCFLLICTWINGWVNNREAGDLIRHRAHYDVAIMNMETPIRPSGLGTKLIGIREQYKFPSLRWKIISMVWCKTAVSPMRYQLRYCGLALSHRYMNYTKKHLVTECGILDSMSFFIHNLNYLLTGKIYECLLF